MKPILILPLILAACVTTQPPCDRYRTECQPGDTRCSCERPEAGDKHPVTSRPEPTKPEPEEPEEPEEPQEHEEPSDKEPDREKDPDGWRDWRDRTPRGGA